MLEFNESTQNSKILALHYANAVGGELLISFMAGKSGPLSEAEASEVIEGFWKMTDLAILDNENGVKIQDISDVEFWMHKLFNKVGGYMAKNGFKDLWQKALDKR